MDLRQMEYLVALADEQQFTRAAAACHVSQSGLSAAIRNLEEELGTTLFSRTTRRVEPTDAGLALLPYARTMLAQSAAARDAVVQATRELSGELRVGAEQCLGIVDVPSLLERFHEFTKCTGNITLQETNGSASARRILPPEAPAEDEIVLARAHPGFIEADRMLGYA